MRIRETMLVTSPSIACLLAAAALRRSRCVDRLNPRDLDAEAGQADIGHAARRGQQPDGIDAQVLEDLRAQPNLAPLPGARLLGRGVAGFRYRHDWYTGGAVAQQHQYA